MSSPADSLVTPEPVFDRRFYPRIAPSGLTHAIFGPEISGELIDLGENGFRLAAPFELSNNFVCRATLPLSGLERPIEVCVRVVWTSAANQAGIQFMDLSDADRAQIRKWVALQEKAPAPAESTEILTGAATQEEPKPEPIQSIPVVAESPKRKNRIAIAVAAACVVVLTAAGLTVWASPLGSWIAKSMAAETKNVFVMAKNRSPESASTSTPLPQTNVAVSADAANVVTTKNEEKQRADVKTQHLEAANDIVGQKRAALTVGVNPLAGNKHWAQKSAMVNAIPVARASIQAELGSSNEALAQSGDIPDGDVKLGSGEEKIETKPQTGLSAAGAARPSGMSDAAPPVSGIRTDIRSTRPAAPTPATFGGAPAEPEFVKTPEPRSSVVDVMLPNNPRPSVVSLPCERIFQSGALTLRIQRAIVAPAGHATWSAERKKRVVLGDLLSRVDPQAPRTADRAGSRVSVRVMLGKDGSVERLMPVNGPAELVPRVMRAVREWRFQPTLLDGKPVETAALVTIEFRGQAAAAASR